jgi:hypothetical protein
MGEVKVQPQELAESIKALEEEEWSTEWATPNAVGWQLTALRFPKRRDTRSQAKTRYRIIKTRGLLALCIAHQLIKRDPLHKNVTIGTNGTTGEAEGRSERAAENTEAPDKRPAADKVTVSEEAKDFIARYLQGGPCNSAKVTQAGIKEGFSKLAIQRSAFAMGVVSTQDPTVKTFNRIWDLPKAETRAGAGEEWDAYASQFA